MTVVATRALITGITGQDVLAQGAFAGATLVAVLAAAAVGTAVAVGWGLAARRARHSSAPRR